MVTREANRPEYPTTQAEARIEGPARLGCVAAGAGGALEQRIRVSYHSEVQFGLGFLEAASGFPKLRVSLSCRGYFWRGYFSGLGAARTDSGGA